LRKLVEGSMGASLATGRRGKFDLAHKADINVTPFVDVMLVLLIIFMVAAPLPTVWLKADMPPPSKAPPPPIRPALITIEHGGKVAFNGQRMTLEQLPRVVRQALGPDPSQQRIMVHASRDVAYKDFMAVMNRLEGEGLTKIALVSENL
jgi:biopolymer transport protein ExbD